MDRRIEIGCALSRGRDLEDWSQDHLLWLLGNALNKGDNVTLWRVLQSARWIMDRIDRDTAKAAYKRLTGRAVPPEDAVEDLKRLVHCKTIPP